MTLGRNLQRFELALSASDVHTALRELASALKAESMGQVAMYHLFDRFLQNIDGDDPRSDAILDSMDLIWGGGWAKGRALFEVELTNEDIAKLGNTSDLAK